MNGTDYKQYINPNGKYKKGRDVMAFNSINGDEYYTLRQHVENIADNLNIPIDSTIWCPFDKEESQFVVVLRERGYNVVATHIDNGGDFFKTPPPIECAGIVSNPPFSKKKDILIRCNELGIKFALIIPLLFVNDGVPLDYGYQLMMWRKRMYFILNGESMDKPRTNCVALSNGLFKKDLVIIGKDGKSNQTSLFEQDQ